MNKLINNDVYANDINRIISNNDFSLLKESSIFITGGLGLICSAVVDILYYLNINNNLNINIYLGCRNKDAFIERYGNCKHIYFMQYDATKNIEIDYDFDYILCGASVSSPEKYINSPVDTMLSNINGIQNLLWYSLNHKTKKLLYISSSEVYGINNCDSLVENIFGSTDINTIRSSYSESKRACEVLCRSFSSQYKLDTVIVRPGHIFGPTASPNDKRVSSLFAYKAAKAENLELKSSGLQKRSYCYCLDCASAILTVLINGKTGESYNIGHDEITSIYEISKMFAEAGNVELKSVSPTTDELKQFNPMNNSLLNNKKIKSIGYKDCFTIKEAVDHTVIILKEQFL